MCAVVVCDPFCLRSSRCRIDDVESIEIATLEIPRQETSTPKIATSEVTDCKDASPVVS